jgi:SAM-dependent methyltransferase
MKTRLLNYLACPACASPFDLEVDRSEGEEIIEGVLRCQACDVSYGIVRGVPRLLHGEISQEQRATADAFGYEWTHFTHIDDTYDAEFLDWIQPVGKEFFLGKLVLDGGCGKGRHAALSSAFGAADVVGVDISDAVEAAFANTRHLPNVHIVQTNIYRLPLRAAFDYAYSIGVLHHLPDPKEGFFSLVRQLKPGGRISAWVYGEEGNWWITHLLTPVRTRITARAPRALTNALSFLIAVPMQLALRWIYRPINRELPSLKRFLFYNDYLYSISGFSFRENYSTVFDHLVAPTAFYINRPDFSRWFQEAGLSAVEISWRNRNSWRGTGVVPPPANPALRQETPVAAAPGPRGEK